MSNKIIIHARPGKKVVKIEQVGQNEYRVDINALAEDNKANERLIEILAEYFNCAQSKLHIRVGHKGRTKIIEVDEALGF